MTSQHIDLTTHTNSTKTRFTNRFLRSLLKMKKINRFGSPTAGDAIRKRSHRIKIAAYSSMASAVGSSRTWSQALLFKIRNRAKFQRIATKRYMFSKKKRVTKKRVSRELKAIDRLRNLVPGGDAMDFYSLLEETAHYIKCLATQVKVMQSIADHYSK